MNDITKEKNMPAELIQQAITSGADLDKLEKVLQMQKQWEQDQARKAYHIAMANFKANPPTIEKDVTVGYSTARGKVGYKHASLANVVSKITSELSKHGLSASWRIQQNEKIIVTCKITHSMGHSEETSIFADADDSGAKNSIQSIGSTITYLERYSLLAILGLATQDQDNDGRVESAKITPEQVGTINKQLEELKSNKDALLKYLGVDAIEDIAQTDYKKVEVLLKQRKDAIKKGDTR